MNDPDRKDVDLAPYEWKSEREKPREPIFGKGAPEWAVYVVSLAASIIAVRYFLGL